MLYRCFRKKDTGQWVNVLFTVAGDQFSVPAESHQGDIARALGLMPQDLETVDANSDLRTGALLELPPSPTDPASTAHMRTEELLAIPRSDWTTAQLRELLQLNAQELMR